MVAAAMGGLLRRGRALSLSYSHTHSLWAKVTCRTAATAARYRATHLQLHSASF